MRIGPRQLLAEALLVTGLVLLAHRVFSLGESFLIGSFDDDGVYTVLGKALAEGKGYHSIHLVGAPVQVKYPPGWPMVLALLWRFMGSAEGVLRAVQWLNPLAVAATAGILWFLARGPGRSEWGPALLLLVAPLLLDPVIQYTAIPLVEPWFMLGWAGALLAWYNARDSDEQPRAGMIALAALLVAVTVLFRTQAMVLVPALLIALWRWKPGRIPSLVAVVALLLPLVLWALYHHALIAQGPVADLPDEKPYTSWLAGGPGPLVQNLWANLRFYTLYTGALLVSPRHLGGVVVAILLGGMLVAAGMQLRHEPFLALGVVGSLGLVLVWPYSQDRLLLSSLPAGGLLLLQFLAPAVARLSIPARRWVNLGGLIALGLVLMRQAGVHQDVVTAVGNNQRPRLFTAGYPILENSRLIAGAGQWILANTRLSDHVMIDRQAAIYLYTGRQTVPASPSESRLSPSVFSVPGQYLARHILQDSLSFVFVGIQKPGIMRDIETLKRRCPGVLTWGGVSPSDPPLILRITPDHACLTPIAAR